ncbi:MAG: hypothetical protein ACTHJL_00695 [Amnibacterium sp.]
MSNTGPGDDDVLAGTFDQTNDQVSGLEGESDGTAQGDIEPGAFRDGRMDGVAPFGEQDAADAETLQEEEVTGRREGAADSDEGRVP